MKAGKYRPAKQSSAADASLIAAQLLLVAYRHLKVTTLDVPLRFLLLNVLLGTERVKRVSFSHLKLEHQVNKSIHCISPLSFLLAAISGASRLTSRRRATRRERRRCGATATRRRPASRTSTAWHDSVCEPLCAETERSFPQCKFWGRSRVCRGQATSLHLCTELSCLGLPLGLCKGSC